MSKNIKLNRNSSPTVPKRVMESVTRSRASTKVVKESSINDLRHKSNWKSARVVMRPVGIMKGLNEDERTFIIKPDSKYFDPSAGSGSLYGVAIDGKVWSGRNQFRRLDPNLVEKVVKVNESRDINSKEFRRKFMKQVEQYSKEAMKGAYHMLGPESRPLRGDVLLLNFRFGEFDEYGVDELTTKYLDEEIMETGGISLIEASGYFARMIGVDKAVEEYDKYWRKVRNKFPLLDVKAYPVYSEHNPENNRVRVEVRISKMEQLSLF